MYVLFVYCNFYCSPAKKNGLDPHILGMATPLLTFDLENLSINVNTPKESLCPPMFQLISKNDCYFDMYRC